MSSKKFIFQKIVYLADTNAFGNTYFAKYFEWQGMARESFFKEVADDYSKMLEKGIKYITISAHIDYKKESVLFDEIEISVEPKNVTLTTVELEFIYVNKLTQEIIALGRQKIGFSDFAGTIVPIPIELIEGASEYLDSSLKNNLIKIVSKIKNRK